MFRQHCAFRATAHDLIQGGRNVRFVDQDALLVEVLQA